MNDSRPSHPTPGGTPESLLTPELERATLATVTWRLLPLLFLCYIIAYVDRINVGFAKLQLREVLGVDEQVFGRVYGFGAGLFFIGYFLFEVPSNLILQRVGARVWIARIMFFWGVVSMGFMFLKCTLAPFWAIATALLSGSTAAAGLAFVNSVGNLGGFAGPYLVGVIRDRTGSNTAALMLLGCALLGMALFALCLPKAARRGNPAPTREANVP